MIQYKGYIGKVEFDDSINAFVGRVVNIRDVVTFVGKSVKELEREMKLSMEDYFDLCKDLKRKPDPPFGGALTIEIDPALYRSLFMEAEAVGASLNEVVVKKLSATLPQPNTSTQRRPPRTRAKSVA